MAQLNHTRYTRIAFTVNNPTEEDIQGLSNIQQRSRFICYAQEVGDNGTPHLQGYIEFVNQTTLRTIKGFLPRAHIERATQSREVNIRYCKKGNISKEVYSSLVRRGMDPAEHPMYGNESYVEWSSPHIQPELTEANVWSTYVEKPREMQLNFTGIQELVEQHHKWADVLRDPRMQQHMASGGGLSYIKELWNTRSFRNIPKPSFYRWQRDLMDILAEPPHHRRIHFFIDEVGNTGKSTMAKYLCSNFDAILLSGKDSDISHAYEGQRVIILDFPRTSRDHINWGIVEKLKNGHLFSGKYNSVMKLYDVPHVIVFANFFPPMDVFSRDRYDIHELKEGDKDQAEYQGAILYYERPKQDDIQWLDDDLETVPTTLKHSPPLADYFCHEELDDSDIWNYP